MRIQCNCQGTEFGNVLHLSLSRSLYPQVGKQFGPSSEQTEAMNHTLTGTYIGVEGATCFVSHHHL